MAVGRVVLVAGILILLFIPYLLWGTGLITARSQNQLRAEFGVAQHLSGPIPKPVSTSPSPGAAGAPPQVAPDEDDPPIGNPVGVIAIPRIDLSMVIVEGIGTAQLEQGPGHYPGTPLPGEGGNVAIAGHRTTYLHPFYDLNELVPGDSIMLTTLQGFFLYHVISSESVSPSDVSVVAPTSSPQLTLTTCTPRYSASQRLVVHATLAASYVVHPRKPVPAVTPAHVSSSAPPRSWPVAILWGIVVAGLTTALWVVASRTRRGRRALVLGGGTLVWVVVVFFFYQSLAPLLPASF